MPIHKKIVGQQVTVERKYSIITGRDQRRPNLGGLGQSFASTSWVMRGQFRTNPKTLGFYDDDARY